MDTTLRSSYALCSHPEPEGPVLNVRDNSTLQRSHLDSSGSLVSKPMPPSIPDLPFLDSLGGMLKCTNKLVSDRSGFSEKVEVGEWDCLAVPSLHGVNLKCLHLQSIMQMRFQRLASTSHSGDTFNSRMYRNSKIPLGWGPITV